GATRCLRRDFQALVETHERFLQSGDHAELNIWDRNRRHLVGYFDEFAEMLHRFLIYPELTPREKYELGLYEGSDGGEEYSAGVEEPLNEEEDHSSMEDSIGEDGEYMEEEGNAGGGGGWAGYSPKGKNRGGFLGLGGWWWLKRG
ncbi:hypothetical protein FS749_009088, partial [Ceratobasidium sp. UAMH 11750]